MAESYKWIVTDSVLKRGSDGASIPADPKNRDCREYLAWVALGNVATAADPAPTAAAILADQVAGAADSFLNSQQSIAIVERAAALVTMDRVNVLHAWLMAFKAATAAATTLADLKTRVAALDALPTFQPLDIKNAIKNKINSGDAN